MYDYLAKVILLGPSSCGKYAPLLYHHPSTISSSISQNLQILHPAPLHKKRM